MSAKRKSFTSVAKPVIRQSPKVAVKSRIDESKTVVSSGLTSKGAAKRGQEPEDASDLSGASDNEEEDSEEEDQPKSSKSKSTGREARKQKADQDVLDTEMTSPDDGQEHGDASEDGEPTSPTFGDLVRGATTVDVSSALAAQATTTVTRNHRQSRSVAPVTSTSLGTVLNQALKTDDRDLLESCLQVNDVNIIQNTINRMDSALAGVLLSKLADRMHRRPGRAFGLMKWMQWTLIAHGGALVAQPGVVNQLSKLSGVLEERSRGLNSLLALKGKLDMLDAQMQFRKAIKNAKSEGPGDDDDESEDVDEPGVVYVEGQEDQPKLANGAAARGEDEDDFPVTNGFGDDSEEDSDEDDEDDLADDLAEIESMDEDDDDLDDVEDESGEEDEEEDDDEVAAPPAKVQKISSKFGKRK